MDKKPITAGMCIMQLRSKQLTIQTEIVRLPGISITTYCKIEKDITGINPARLNQLAASGRIRNSENEGPNENLTQSQHYTNTMQDKLTAAYQILGQLKQKCKENGGILDLLG